MPDHPETYTMSRAEWLEINRVLAGSALALYFFKSRQTMAKRLERLQAVRDAQGIMSKVYDRAVGP